MTARKKLKFDDSWDPKCNILYQAWYGEPDSLKRELDQLYGTLRGAISELVDMTYEDEELDWLIRDWWDLLGEVSRESISYWDGNAIKARLEDLTEEFLPEIRKEIQVLKLRQPPKPSATAVPTTSTGTTSTRKGKAPKTLDMEDDLTFATAFANTSQFGMAKAKRRPKDVRPKAKPFVLPTPQEEWANYQRQMAQHCDNGYNRYITNRLCSDSDHAVNQESVSRHLGAGSHFQVRPSDNTNDEMRIYLKTSDVEVQYWARGLSHHQTRVAGAYYVYRRIGKGKTFIHIAGRKLEKHAAA